MNVITPGHKYELSQFDRQHKNQIPQTIQFIEKLPANRFLNPMEQQQQAIDDQNNGTNHAAELETINNGTTNEEVLAMLIDRVNFLQAKFPCRENAIALTHIETALLWLNKRTADRLARGVEGKQLK